MIRIAEVARRRRIAEVARKIERIGIRVMIVMKYLLIGQMIKWIMILLKDMTFMSQY